MSPVPPNVVTDPVKELAEWYALKQRIAAECAPLIASERLLRQRLFNHFFPTPAEGTNTFVLPDGYQVKGKYPIDRKVDQGILDAFRTMRVCDLSEEDAAQLGIDTSIPDQLITAAMRFNIDQLLRYTPELQVKQYRTLTAEQQRIFDRCLEVKPGSITLEVVEPAKPRGGKAEGFGEATA